MATHVIRIINALATLLYSSCVEMYCLTTGSTKPVVAEWEIRLFMTTCFVSTTIERIMKWVDEVQIVTVFNAHAELASQFYLRVLVKPITGICDLLPDSAMHLILPMSRFGRPSGSIIACQCNLASSYVNLGQSPVI